MTLDPVKVRLRFKCRTLSDLGEDRLDQVPVHDRLVLRRQPTSTFPSREPRSDAVDTIVAVRVDGHRLV